MPAALETRMMLDGIVAPPSGMNTVVGITTPSGSGTVTSPTGGSATTGGTLTPTSGGNTTPTGGTALSSIGQSFLDFAAAHPNATAEEDFAFLMAGSGLSPTQIHSIYLAGHPVENTGIVGSPPPAIQAAVAFGQGARPLDTTSVVRISTVVQVSTYAVFDTAEQTYEEIIKFQKITTKEVKHRFVDPVEYLATQHLFDVSGVNLALLTKEVNKLERAIADFKDPWFYMQFMFQGPFATATVMGNDILDSMKDVLASKENTQSLEAGNWARLKRQLETGEGLTWREVHEIEYVANGTQRWHVSNGYIPASVWGPWCQAHGLGNNPPDEFAITNVATYNLAGEMPQWIRGLYDQSNPGGGLW